MVINTDINKKQVKWINWPRGNSEKIMRMVVMVRWVSNLGRSINNPPFVQKHLYLYEGLIAVGMVFYQKIGTIHDFIKKYNTIKYRKVKLKFIVKSYK